VRSPLPDRFHDGLDTLLSVGRVVDEALLLSTTEQLGAELAEPLKTTVVQNQRSMTTWVLRKKLL